MSYNPVVYFISQEYFFQNTPVEQNVDWDKIQPFCVQCTQLYLQQSIGETGLNALSNGVKNNTLTPDEETFIRNYVQPMVCQYTLWMALPFINFKATNKALSKESSEYSQAADLDEMKYLRSNVKDAAEFFQRRMVKYLADHPGKFQWYDHPDALDNLPKTIQSYFGGIYMGFGYGGSYYPTWTEPYGSTSPCTGCGTGWSRRGITY
jgi:hypothetical protein